MSLWTLALAAALAGAPLRTEVATGDCGAVLAAATPTTDPSARLALAWCQLRTGDAAAVVATLEKPSGILASYEKLVAAEALLDLGRPADAAARLDGVTLPGDAGERVRLLRGRAGLAVQREGARAELEGLAKTDLGREAAYWIALSLPAGAESRDLLRQLWTDARPGGWDARAAEQLTKVGAPVPELTTPDGRSLALQRVNSLRKVNRNAEALTLLTALRAIEPATTRAGKVQWAKTNAEAHQYGVAAAGWRAVLGPPDTADGEAAELFDYALMTARSGDYDTAAVIYRRLMALHPDTDEADFASFKLGYMEYDRRDCAAAVPLFDAHVASHPDSKHLDEALWFAGRCAWRSQDLARAEKDWAALIAQRPQSSLVAGAAYWRARAKGVAGDAAGERAGLEKVIATWPTSGYAWFAAERVGKTFAPHAAATPPAWPAALASNANVQRGEALLAAGLQGWARDELARVDATGTKETALAAAWARLRAGDYNGAKKLAGPYCVSPWKAGDPVAQQVCTPSPEAEIVGEVAARFGLDAQIAYGVMNAESGLDPTVTSPAGARGLMQLMPDLAGRLHSEIFGDRAYNPDDLYSAPYNAALGTAELGARGKDLAGALAGVSSPAVIASYNGGIEAVRRWISEWGHAPEPDEFAEDVGYTETRLYVKRVLGYVMAYRWVYGDPAGS